MKKSYKVTGMGCAACSARVETGVSKMDGVIACSVNLLTNSMEVEFDQSKLDSKGIIEKVEDLGYGAEEDGEEGEEGDGQGPSFHKVDFEEEEKTLKRRLIISIIFAIPLMYIYMGPMIGLPLPPIIDGVTYSLRPGGMGGHMGTFYVAGAMLLAPILWVNFKFYKVGLPALFKGHPNMDSLIAVGTIASICLLYFDSAGMILTLVTLGKYLEARAKKKTGQAINLLIDLNPETVRVIRDGEELTVEAKVVRAGEKVLAGPGERIAFDGVILQGQTSIDQSVITGESMPVDKAIGDQVISGTMNLSGAITYEAKQVGKDTTLSKIIELVGEASSSKAPISKLADKVSGIFVPVVMIIALLSTILWLATGQDLSFALSIGISVLVISCPCALGLATPVAIMVGTGRGAREGILIKSAESLEILGKIDTLVFDKTGTITKGQPKVSGVYAFGQYEEKQVVSICGCLEESSEHPLGKAINEYAKEQGAKAIWCENFNYTFGRGITGQVDGASYWAGNQAMIDERVSLGQEVKTLAEDLMKEGKTLVYLANDKELMGIISLEDQPKAGAKEAIEGLERMGVEAVIVSGDNEAAAEAVGRKVGITHVVAEVMPDQKDKAIKDLQSQGKVVAMVGDGVNDGPAIMRADVGIAMGAGTDIAIEAADVVIMGDEVETVERAVVLGRETVANIKRSLFWAFFYNAICIPVAAGALYPIWGITLNPMIGAAAMSMSSVCVVLNALSLRKSRHHR